MWLDYDCLVRLVQMLLQIRHKRGAAGADGRGVGGTGLMLAEDIAIGVADVDFPELCQQAHASAVG